MKGREYQFLNPLMFWIFFLYFEYPLSKSCARPWRYAAALPRRRAVVACDKNQATDEKKLVFDVRRGNSNFFTYHGF
jgi:hypothetical protein